MSYFASLVKKKSVNVCGADPRPARNDMVPLWNHVDTPRGYRDTVKTKSQGRTERLLAGSARSTSTSKPILGVLMLIPPRSFPESERAHESKSHRDTLRF